MSSDYIFSSKEHERDWVIQIKNTLMDELENSTTPVSIYQVPKSLSSVKSEAYSPQLIALGPYHHLRPDLYDMERHKLAAAKRVNKKFQNVEFQTLADELKRDHVVIRSCYHKYLNLSNEALAYIMAIDGLFLLELLTGYVNRDGALQKTCETVQSAGKKLTKNAILRDIMMLENQIPFSVLEKIMTIECPKPEVLNNLLPSMLLNFCKALCPLEVEESPPTATILDHAHLLDLMYDMILPQKDKSFECSNGNQREDDREQDFCSPGNPFQDVCNCCHLALNSNFGFMRGIKKPLQAGKRILKAPGISKIVSRFTSSHSNGGSEVAGDPLVGSLKIPTASCLHDAGVKFKQAKGISKIKFDVKTITLHLPLIKLDVNSEVVLRNLVAYEAVTMTDSLVFSRYMELMNGLIDTAEDVTLLIQKKIMKTELPEGEVAGIFNGMSKSIGSTKVKNIDETIEKVNKFYDGIPKVMAYKLVKRYVFASWKILTVMASLLLLGLMALQSFCSVYNCPRYFKTTTKMA